MFDDIYKMISNPVEGLYKEKGSKFIALAYPVYTDEEIKEHLSRLKKEYYDARHHCYAWALGPIRQSTRINDDGEPSGTAGRPIMGQILSYDVTNILIVVIRYFGGTKLGVSGLIQAYKTAASEALQTAIIKECTINEVYDVFFEYPLMNQVMKVLKDFNLEIINQVFEMDCKITFMVRRNQSQQVEQIFKDLQGVNVKYVKTI